jgi:hypothetical protein
VAGIRLSALFMLMGFLGVALPQTEIVKCTARKMMGRPKKQPLFAIILAKLLPARVVMKKNLITGFLIATPLVGLWLFLGVKDEQNQNDKKSPKASSSGIYRTNSSERGNIQRFNSHVKEIESGEFVLAERYSIWAGDLPILLEGMTVEELLDAGKRAAKFKNQRIKTLFSTEIVAELARRDNFEEALSLVPLHRSVFRDQLMRYLFGHW